MFSEAEKKYLRAICKTDLVSELDEHFGYNVGYRRLLRHRIRKKARTMEKNMRLLEKAKKSFSGEVELYDIGPDPLHLPRG